MRSLGRAGRLTAGAMGPPGRRTFYLEVDGAAGHEWFVMEKEQVAALAAFGLELLGRPADTPAQAAKPDVPEGGPAFRVAEVALSTEAAEVFVLLTPTEEAEPVAFSVTPAIFTAMAAQALAVVAAGRPICRLCGLPLDPEGHACSGGNGDLRHR